MVLQRWQTVYLFIAAVLSGIAVFSPVCGIASPAGMENLSLANLLQGTTHLQAALAYFILTALAALLAFATIFKYKDLKRQQSLCSVTMLLILAAYAILFICRFSIENATVDWKIASLAPAFALICTLLAKNRIAADYKLIHAADRLR